MKTVFVNLNDLYDPNRVITNPQPLNKDKKFSSDGLFSEVLFGRKNDSDMISYQCDCGKYKGKFLEGWLCENCNSTVRQTQPMIEKLCWIDLGKYYIINPVFYYEIAKLCGGVKNLNEIINYDKKIDRDGNIIRDEKNKYNNIGLVAFKENFVEILAHLYKTSKYSDKNNVFLLLNQNSDNIFMNHIPVFDTSLRPATVTFKDKPIFKFDEINKNCNFIIKLANMSN